VQQVTITDNSSRENAIINWEQVHYAIHIIYTTLTYFTIKNYLVTY